MSATGTCAEACVEALRRAGHGNAFAVPPAAWYCPDPVVCSCGEWAEESRQADGSVRGVRRVLVTCCCEDPGDAEATCRGVAATLASCAWGWSGDLYGVRVVAVTVGPCGPAGRDGSGRWLWEVDVDMTVVVKGG